MQEILRDVKVGEKYVVIDGTVLLANAANVEFNGWHAHHKFAILPQFAALDEKSILEEKLGSRRYWDANALPED